MLKILEYSIRYMIFIVIAYYILGLSAFYVPNLSMLCIVPINFLAVNYGIFNKIDKDKLYYKYDILMSLVFITNIFIIIFLTLNKVNVLVIVFSVFIHTLELVYTDSPREKEKKNKKLKKKK